MAARGNGNGNGNASAAPPTSAVSLASATNAPRPPASIAPTSTWSRPLGGFRERPTEADADADLSADADFEPPQPPTPTPTPTSPLAASRRALTNRVRRVPARAKRGASSVWNALFRPPNDSRRKELLVALAGRHPLDPLKPFHKAWDLTNLAMVLYTVIQLPLELAYAIPLLPLVVFNLLANAFFLCDIVVNFVTSYVDDAGTLVLDYRSIRRHYVRTWLLFDLLASIPVDIITLALAAEGQDNTDTIRVITAFKALRILRLTHVFRLISRFNISANLQLALMFVAYLTTAHWMGCLYWIVASLEGFDLSLIHI